MTALLLALLAQSPVIAQQGRGIDGGLTWAVNCTNCSGGGGASWFPDGGYIGQVSVPGGVTADLRDAGVNVLNFPATQAVSGTVTANAGTGNFTVAQATAANLNATVTGTVAATQSGVWQTQALDSAGVAVASKASAPAGTEQAWVVRNIPSGTQAVSGTVDARVTGNGGAAFDAANNAAAPANVLAIGFEAQTGQSAAATTGNVRRATVSVDGALWVRQGGPVEWSCTLSGIAATLTQCQAAPGAGLSLYITDIVVQTTTTTSGTYAVQYGTGTNCGTGTAALFPGGATANRWNAPITTSSASNFSFITPLVVPANNALCVIGVATNTIRIQMNGYTAP